MKKSRWVCWLALGTITLQTVSAPLVQAEGWMRPAPQTTVHKLAKQIDRVEKTIDEYGSVVLKTPDVWGQARLTKYRVEYEKILAKKSTDFEPTINAAISRSDQAFLTSAFSLQAAISGSVATQGKPITTVTQDSTKTTTTTTTQENKVSKPEVATNPLDNGLVTTTQTDLVRKDDILGFGNGSVALEPTVMLDQLSRYMQHLHELRRINDGDDSADSPGYALHLVRLPVSVLPGKKTREGYGAEVTITAKPHLHEKLLPETVRSLVINDLVDHFSFPMAKFLDSDNATLVLKDFEMKEKSGVDLAIIAKEANELFCALNTIIEQLSTNTPDKDVLGRSIIRAKITSNQLHCQLTGNSVATLATMAEKALNIYNLLSETEKEAKKSMPTATDSSESLAAMYLADEAQIGERKTQWKQLSQDDKYNFNVNELQALTSDVSKALPDMLRSSGIILPSISTAPSRRASLPYPTSQGFDTLGYREIGHIALLANGVKGDPRNEKNTLLLDLQRFFGEEFQAAYEYLNHRPELWVHATPQLASAVRLKNASELATLRTSFLQCIPEYEDRNSMQRHTAPLCWAIIVESALLNERLIEDIRNLASAKNAMHLNGEGMTFIGCHPDPMACEAFNQYVMCRWPVHVFAIDPVTQDQNVADAFSMRREMQLALSLAFSSGRIGAQNFTRMARRLELDMETIALNRTIVGFSHGDDTFGWRFTPRIQSPDTKGTIGTFAELLVKGGPNRDDLLKQHRLEPGVRECTALVLMPAFVPYVIFDSRTNWFKLNNPARKELDLTDGVGLSAEITCLKELSTQCAADAHCYRPDEVYRLTRAVEQLDRRLPLQTSYVQMPFEANLGGFEFFSTGTADLAPEVKGFYGEEGIVVDGKNETKSTIFVLGDHFSVHETRVIVGNQEIPSSDRELLSRQVMQLTVPGNITVASDGTVDCHVATPYGISNHLQIPVAKIEAAKAVEDAVKTAIEAHVATTHFDRLKWGKPELQVRLTLDDRRHVVDVKQQADTTIVIDSSSPFQDDAQTARFRGWMHLQLKGGEVKTDKPFGQTMKMDLKFDKGKFHVTTHVNMGETPPLEKSLREAFAGQTIPADLESIEIQGFVKFLDEDSKLDAQPVIRFDNRLKLKLEFCMAECPKQAPSATPAAMATPFDEPAAPVTEGESGPQPLRIIEPQPPRTFKWATSKARSGRAPSLGSSPIRHVSVESTEVGRSALE